MAAKTESFLLTDQNWTMVAADATNAAIQFLTRGSAEIYLGQDIPSEASVGIRVSQQAEASTPSTFSLSNMPLGAALWVRRITSDNIRIVVLSY